MSSQYVVSGYVEPYYINDTILYDGDYQIAQPPADSIRLDDGILGDAEVGAAVFGSVLELSSAANPLPSQWGVQCVTEGQWYNRNPVTSNTEECS